jgi:predicted DNA-binding transcriptional regulator AlpA
MSTASPFVLPDEADAITHTHDVTRRRMEKRGLFPRRVRIGSRKVAYRRNEFEQWCADPEGWRQRHAVDGGAQ